MLAARRLPTGKISGVNPATRALHGERVALRPLAAADAARLREIHLTPEVSAWWGSMAEGFPLSDEPEATRFAIEIDGDVAGMIQFREEDEPDYRHAAVDLFVDPRVHSRGVGTDALRTLVRHLLEDRGHHRVTIDPTLDNAAAIRCYEKAGFRPVGVMREAERSPEGVWRDALFMELLARDFR